MNIIVTITVGLNVLQNASKGTISKEKIPKFFWGGGTALSPDLTPVGAFNASIRVPKALQPPPNHISGYGPVCTIVWWTKKKQKAKNICKTYTHSRPLAGNADA